jgi:hypothetical protein
MTQAAKETKIEIFVNRRKLELHVTDLTGATLLVDAGFDGEGWDLLQLQGEGDPTGGEVVQADQPLHLKNGERFRVIPGNRTFGQR